MNEIKEMLKTKSFVINDMIIRNVSKLDLTLNEFLLLIYFINVSNKLDIESINEHLSLSEEVILNIFNDLIKKSMIEVVVKKNPNTIEEEISLEPFYNKLVLNLEPIKDDKKDDIFASFENEFGRTLSPIEYETINNWLDNKVSEDMIKKALKEAVLSGVSNLRYIDKIIYEWTKKGVKEGTKSNDYKPLFDYDWLKDNNER